MNERIPCEFFLIRYVPDVAKGEFVNVGVILREVALRDPEPRGAAQRAGRGTAAMVRFTQDWSRVRRIDAGADVETLEALEVEIAKRLEAEMLGTDASAYTILSTMRESFSNSVQIAEPRICLAESVAREMDLLMRLHVEPLRVGLTKRERAEQAAAVRESSGRAAVVAAMRQAFERAGVWAEMDKRIPVAEYTHRGDPMKIDCGYRPNGVIRMFHAVSLKTDVEGATRLAYTAPRLRDGVMRVKGATLELTAVVEELRAVSSGDFTDEAGERYEFGVQAMEHEQIRVLTVAGLAAAATRARVELHG